MASATHVERSYVHVINFVLVVVIAQRLLQRKSFHALAFACAAVMSAIAIKQAISATASEPAFERRRKVWSNSCRPSW